MSLSPEVFDRIFAGWEVWANGHKVGLVADKVVGQDGLYLDVAIQTPPGRQVRLPFQYVGGVQAGRVHLTLKPEDLTSERWTISR